MGLVNYRLSWLCSGLVCVQLYEYLSILRSWRNLVLLRILEEDYLNQGGQHSEGCDYYKTKKQYPQLEI